MKILKIDKKYNEIIVIPETSEDLWHLEKIIESGDIISGKTDRKIKAEREGEKTQRITIFVDLEIKEVHFQEYSENLRVNGIIIKGKPEELIQIKSHQSIDIEKGEKVIIKKKAIKEWQIDRLKKAEKESATTKLLIILLDDEEAELAFVNQFSITKKAKIKSKKSGKRFAEEKSDYFEKIMEKIIQLEPKKILIVGPGFTKENFKKFYEEKKPKGAPTAFIETTNEIGETGFKELITQGKLKTLEKELQLSKEGEIIEEFLSLISKGKTEYGKEKVTQALEIGAVEKLIISETTLMQERKEIEKIMNIAEMTKCEIIVISSKNPQEKIIQNLSGVGAILRYKLE
ncbi:MAG: mRNA surveillance protein pelota [Candidatus Diapherotrites archaeon]|uniref:Protein pelota homolog n=1 Tax=Candidatus Iainarchaeum sp. TaxID=3101447 RepID=A0A7K4BYV3_9ARCH|nr:mRNA surveillance protein pelota [Candidatus Diapherotrites archaeon]